MQWEFNLHKVAIGGLLRWPIVSADILGVASDY